MKISIQNKMANTPMIIQKKIKVKLEPMENLYNIVFNYAKKIRKKVPNFTIDDIWGYIADDIPDVHINELCAIDKVEWNNDIQFGGTTYRTFADKIMNLPEYYITGNYEQVLQEKNHYFMQILRIPNQNILTLRILMKLAVYNGLLTANLLKSDFPDGLVKLYKNLHLYRMNTYLKYSDWSKLTINPSLIHIIKIKLYQLYKNLSGINLDEKTADKVSLDESSDDETII